MVDTGGAVAVWVNSVGDDAVALWVNGDLVKVHRAPARRIIKALLDAGIPVESYWTDCVEREAAALDVRIGSGHRDPGLL